MDPKVCLLLQHAIDAHDTALYSRMSITTVIAYNIQHVFGTATMRLRIAVMGDVLVMTMQRISSK